MAIALLGSGCSTSRKTVRASEKLKVESSGLRDSSRVEREVVAVYDTIMETTTIHIQTNEAGDTLKVAQVTERDRIRDRAQVKDQHERVVMKTDTVYVAIRDSTNVKESGLKVQGTGTKSNFVLGLKWIFWILVCVIVLVIVFKVTKFINLK